MNSIRGRRRFRCSPVVAAIGLTVVAACAAPVGGGAAVGPTPTSPAPLTTAPTSAAPAPTTTTPVPTSAPPPYPTDGTNLAACRDGSCQVRVRRGAVIRPGPGRPVFTVASIDADSVRFLLRYPDGTRASLDLEPGRYAGFANPMRFEIDLDEIGDDDTAVITIAALR